MAAGPADTANLRWPPCPSFSKYKTERNVSAVSLNLASDTERVMASATAIALFVVPKSMPTDIECGLPGLGFGAPDFASSRNRVGKGLSLCCPAGEKKVQDMRRFLNIHFARSLNEIPCF